MPATFTSSVALRKCWECINEDAFSGRLPSIADIGWQDLSDEPDDVDLYGGYGVRSNAIGITHELQRFEEVSRELDRFKAMGPAGREDLKKYLQEQDNLISAVLGLVAHETAHQAAHYFDNDARSHGEAFVKAANAIAKAMQLPEVKLRDASTWPNVLPLIKLERQRVAR